MNLKNNLFMKKFLKYKNSLNEIKEFLFRIPIALSSDNKYAPLMYISMTSILKNGNKNTFYEFFLLVPQNFSKKFERTIIALNDQYKCSIKFIYIKNEFEKITMKIPHITLTTYYRLLFGELLPADLEKCIYLDVDICVCKDLSDLYNIDLKNKYIAGVISPTYYYSQKRNCKRLNLPTMKNYINAGMMLINLNQIRKNNMTEKFIELSKKNYSSQDQDVINVACFRKIKIIPPKYNAQIMRLYDNNPLLEELYNKQDIIEAKNSPYIIHYSTEKKPWNSLGIFMESYWWDIAKKTPYINFFSRENIYKSEAKKWFYLKTKKLLNLDRPKTFEEKIQWLNLYDSTPLKTSLSDKILVREWVKSKIGEDYLIPLLGIYDSFDNIDFETLPKKFVIKCNHGRGCSIIVKDRKQLNMTKVKILIDNWMNKNFAFQNGLNLQFKDIKPKILIEKFISDNLKLYEYFSFNSKPYYISVNNEKFGNKTRLLFDLNWNQLTFGSKSNNLVSIKKPFFLETMSELASLLSHNFSFVGINFYATQKKIYFDKFSFTYNGENIISNKVNKKLGSLIKLPKTIYNIDKSEYYILRDGSFCFFPYLAIFIFIIFKFFFGLKK